MIVLDASVLIAHFNHLDTHHVAATALLRDSLPGELLVHGLTLAEVLVGGVLVGRGAGMREDIRAIGILLAPTDPDEPLRLAELRASSRLKLPDCCVLDAAVRARASLATFDDALAAAARGRGVSVLP